MKETPESSSQTGKKEVPVLLISVLIIAVCGILYELLISTISTYFLGSSILHFSITIGLFLSAMGIGSYLSRFLDGYLLEKFINIEIALGAIGGFSALILNASFSLTENYYLTALFLIVLIGTGIGLEIPIITRILKKYDSLKDTISNVLAFDYIGSLLASVLFPLFLLPYLGLLRTSFFVGFINLAIAVTNTIVFKDQLHKAGRKLFISMALLVAMVLGFVFSFQFSGLLEQMVYADNIIYSEQTPYQRVVVTQNHNDMRLYINGNLQFSTIDEYRYHEPLVQVPLSLVPRPEKVLLLGAGDGLAVRELLKMEDRITEIHLVDLDSAITNLAKENPLFTRVNGYSLVHPKVTVFNQDAFNFVQNSPELYNLVIIDLPDPNSASLGKLYSREFYQMVQKVMARDAVLITQSTSPYFAVLPFWCIHETLKTTFPEVVPMNVYLPTFGMWGFNLATNYGFPDGTDSLSVVVNKSKQFLNANAARLQNRFLTPEVADKLFLFEKDMLVEEVEPNMLNDQKLVQYYEGSWGKWD